MLDHTAFPDVIDAVFSYADHSGLLALRGASTSFRDRVDALLSRDLVLRADRISPSSSLGWNPALISLRGSTSTKASTPKSTVDLLLPLFSRTVTLDIDSPPDFPCYPLLSAASGAFTALETLRLRPSSHEDVATPLALAPDKVVVRTPWPPHPSSGFPIAEPAGLLEGARKLVYNVDPSQPLFPSILDRVLRERNGGKGKDGVRELVVVFLPPASDIIDARDRALLRTIISKALEAADPGDDADDASGLTGTATGAGVREAGGEGLRGEGGGADGTGGTREGVSGGRNSILLTFVNTDEVPAECIPVPSSEFDDYITVDEDGVMSYGFGQTLPALSFLHWKRDETREIHPLERYVRATLLPDLGAEVYKRIRLLSMEEYRSEVGREAFDLEVEWTAPPGS